jgi:tetratricopeptide (TPR) repeat protein
MFEMKPISLESVPAALDRAERYRLLGEPAEAESICLDVLDVDPANQRALIVLLLALTDQFESHLRSTAVTEATKVLMRIEDDYKKLYYHGVICERRAKANFRRGGMGDRFKAYEWFRQAMEYYERAEEIKPEGNDEAILRWNACARILNRHKDLEPAHEEAAEHMLE